MSLMFHIRKFEESDSIVELTSLLHRAYARLGGMGLNYTAVDQTPEVTAKRIHGGNCFVAEAQSKLVGTIVAQPTYAENVCEYFTRPGVAAVHQFAVDPAHQGEGVQPRVERRYDCCLTPRHNETNSYMHITSTLTLASCVGQEDSRYAARLLRFQRETGDKFGAQPGEMR